MALTPEVYATLQEFLDVLSQTPGAIIYRGADSWEALEPGPVGYILSLNASQIPYWRDPATLP